MITNDYVIMERPITSRNHQAKIIIERMHQTIGNILCTFIVQNIYWMTKNLEKIFLNG